MKFTFEEAELINALFEDTPLPSPAAVIDIVKDAKDNAEDQEIVELADSLVKKLSLLEDHVISDILKDIPIDCYTDFGSK